MQHKNILNRITINNEKNFLQLPVEKIDEYNSCKFRLSKLFKSDHISYSGGGVI